MKATEVLRRILLIPLLGCSLLILYDFAQAAGLDDEVAPIAPENSSALKNQKEKLSYALGLVFGNRLRNLTEEVDMDLLVQGLKDAHSGGKALMTEKEVRATISQLQTELRKKRVARVGPTALSGIRVSFKIDPRLTRGIFMGDLWVSPPTYTSAVQEGKEATVEARAAAVDARGRPMDINPEWVPADPEMVTVTPRQGNEVKITVKRAGQSNLKVASRDVSKTLSIKAMYKGDAIQVEISQKP